jgi:hypothetical protein
MSELTDEHLKTGLSRDVAESTWATRELPLLTIVLRRFDAGEQFVDLEEARAELEMPGPQMWAAANALRDAFPPYIDVEFAGGWGDLHASGLITHVYERTRRELGSWPSPEGVLDQLVAALSEAAESEPEPERKGRLRTAADVLSGVAHEVAVREISRRLGQL